MEKTHIESGDSIYSFTNDFLVECPKCRAMAKVHPHRSTSFYPEKVTLTCSFCGHNQISAECELSKPKIGPFDFYFLLPLWLRTRCCGKELWAFNRDHLEYLESFIIADHRKRASKEVNPLRSRTFESRLPKWIKSSKNREEILKGIQRLKMKLPSEEACKRDQGSS